MTIRYQKTQSQKPVPHREIAQEGCGLTSLEQKNTLETLQTVRCGWRIQCSGAGSGEKERRMDKAQGGSLQPLNPGGKAVCAAGNLEDRHKTHSLTGHQCPTSTLHFRWQVVTHCLPQAVGSHSFALMAATALILLLGHFLSLSGSDQQKAIPDEPYLGPLAFVLCPQPPCCLVTSE